MTMNVPVLCADIHRSQSLLFSNTYTFNGHLTV